MARQAEESSNTRATASSPYLKRRPRRSAALSASKVDSPPSTGIASRFEPGWESTWARLPSCAWQTAPTLLAAPPILPPGSWLSGREVKPSFREWPPRSRVDSWRASRFAGIVTGCTDSRACRTPSRFGKPRPAILESCPPRPARSTDEVPRRLILSPHLRPTRSGPIDSSDSWEEEGWEVYTRPSNAGRSNAPSR